MFGRGWLWNLACGRILSGHTFSWDYCCEFRGSTRTGSHARTFKRDNGVRQIFRTDWFPEHKNAWLSQHISVGGYFTEPLRPYNPTSAHQSSQSIQNVLVRASFTSQALQPYTAANIKRTPRTQKIFADVQSHLYYSFHAGRVHRRFALTYCSIFLRFPRQ